MVDPMEEFDLDEELYDGIFKKSKKNKMSKEKALYGIWAESEDEEDLTITNLDGKNPVLNNPINFVGSVKPKKPSALDGIDVLKPPNSAVTGSKATQKGIKRKENKDFAKWSSNTSGFGMKMLLKMGYKVGKGLGKDENGIVDPIKASVRKGKGGIGAYEEEKSNVKQSIEIVDFDDFNYDKKEKKTKEIKQRDKFSYKTLEDLRVGDLSEDIKVMDMRSRETKTYNNMAEYKENETKLKLQRDFEMDELLHNLDSLVSISQKRLISIDSKNKYNQDLLTNYHQEIEFIKKQMESQVIQKNKLETISEMIEKCVFDNVFSIHKMNCNLDVLICLVKFSEFHEYGLSAMCIPALLPHLKHILEENDIINMPRIVLEAFEKFKLLASKDAECRCQAINRKKNVITVFEFYEKVLWFNLIPKVRQHFSECNQPLKFTSDGVTFIEKWKSLIPKWLENHVITQIFIPKLHNFIENWNPQSSPIHEWTLPWMPYLNEDLTDGLYVQIYHKISFLLRNWHPSNSFAKNTLLPFNNVFNKSTFHNLLVRLVKPKLEHLISNEFEVNPAAQNIDPFKWLLEWCSVLPDEDIVSILERFFFTKWLNVLHMWLSQDEIDFNQVTVWYKGWKNMFPDSVISHETIKKKMAVALNMMNDRAQGVSIQSTVADYIKTFDRAVSSNTKTTNNKNTYIKVSSTSSMNFKDIVENYATENGIVFKPAINYRVKDGKTYYVFGNTTIYIDRNVIFYCQNGDSVWNPISLTDLISLAK